MKIYVLKQDENDGYDTYDSLVVAAEDEESARQIHPNDAELIDPWDKDKCWREWCLSPDDVSVEYIGTYEGKRTEPHIILASYNAG
jgi:hypothetical protein